MRAKTERSGRISMIWIIPIIAIAVAGWLAWRTISQNGPVITITFQAAEGLEAGKSHVRHKDVDMGLVQSIVLSPDLSHVIVTVQMSREAEPVLTDKATFWVVRPRLFAGSVSGLSTLVSGSYIELLPSTEPGERRREFTGREEPPVLEPNTPGTSFLLEADRLGSISLGAPIFYRDLTVGTVQGWDLKDMARHVTIHAFIRAPYDKYVTDRSRFWDASGVSLKLGADGIQLQLESLRAVLLGGVAFETPDEARNDPPSAAGRGFTLYASHDAAA
jgi:paraquat-inducible protein B